MALQAAATGAPMVFPYMPTAAAASIRAATTNRGFGSPLRAACAGSTLTSTLSESPPSPHINPLLMASDATDGCSGPISAGPSALAALEGAPHLPAASAAAAAATVPAPAAPAAAAPQVAPAAAAPVASAAGMQDAYDARMYVDATVQGVTRGAERRNYRLTLRLEEGEKVLSMRIGDTEGASLASLLRQSRTSRFEPPPPHRPAPRNWCCLSLYPVRLKCFTSAVSPMVWLQFHDSLLAVGAKCVGWAWSTTCCRIVLR